MRQLIRLILVLSILMSLQTRRISRCAEPSTSSVPSQSTTNEPKKTVAAPAPRLDANSKIAHEQMVESLSKGRIDVYFVGDSITRRWRATDFPLFLANWNQNFFGWNAANFGWGGDTVQNILWRLENGELEGTHPKAFVLLAGTNNLGRSPADAAKAEEVATGINAIIKVLQEKSPQATIILMGILPRNDGSDPLAMMASIDKINERLRSLADGNKVRYLSINRQLLGDDSRLLDGVTVDKLHLSEKGYQIWADALKPVLTELLGPPSDEDLAPPPLGDPSSKKQSH